MSAIAAHLLRGATAAVLVAWAFAFASTQPVLAIAAAVMAGIAMRGCPACWLFGLAERVMHPH
jgi:hypothetical protein